MISGKQKNNGETDKDFEKEIKAMRMWAGEIGFGTEYFFVDNFSIGREFGLRNFIYHFKIEDDKPVYDPISGNYYNSERETKNKIMINSTYTRLSLNFYF